ncbi:helix-turn-helix domain-containing protein [Rhizobium leguminosarum]|uniref:helix-turn-helix domain-containing protein n=1 Tax=Rhizobium leguminosarum TaxID=384 RepID=UPI0003792AB1|nr:helix-turn-helix transcriptional regulator [Rhizobium leguminosarum]
MMREQTPTKDHIANAMQTLGLNQPRFADELGVDQGTVSKWINGKANPSGPVLKLIERMLKEHAA